jgi:hypothetical protein
MRILLCIQFVVIATFYTAAIPCSAAQDIKNTSAKNEARMTYETRISALEARIGRIESTLAAADVSRTDQMRKCVDAHAQIYPGSCIPMSVELVLILAGRVATSYYDLQFEWKKRPYNAFNIFAGRTVAGLTFQRSFTMPRSAKFPFKDLFAAIEKELDAERFVLIGLRDDDQGSFHAWIIAERLAGGEYRGFTKYGSQTIEATDIKARITSNGGTEIGTYTSISEVDSSQR